MRLDRFTNKFQQALADAQSLAVGHSNQFIEPVHLLSAFLHQEGGSVRPLLASAGRILRSLIRRLMTPSVVYRRWKVPPGMCNPLRI